MAGKARETAHERSGQKRPKAGKPDRRIEGGPKAGRMPQVAPSATTGREAGAAARSRGQGEAGSRQGAGRAPGSGGVREGRIRGRKRPRTGPELPGRKGQFLRQARRGPGGGSEQRPKEADGGMAPKLAGRVGTCARKGSGWSRSRKRPMAGWPRSWLVGLVRAPGRGRVGAVAERGRRRGGPEGQESGRGRARTARGNKGWEDRSKGGGGRGEGGKAEGGGAAGSAASITPLSQHHPSRRVSQEATARRGGEGGG